MAWKQPKTDWAGKSDADGNYTGDYFNADDYNRIKNNIAELCTLANSVYYPEISIQDADADKAVGDYLYADEINVLENNLDKICQGTIPKLAGKKKAIMKILLRLILLNLTGSKSAAWIYITTL